MSKINNFIYRINSLVAFLLHSKSKSALKGYPGLQTIKKVLIENPNNSNLKKIEKLRNQLCRNNELVEVFDPGAGSLAISGKKRSIADIAKSSLSSKGQCRFMHDLIYLNSSITIVELGTSLGISTAYLAAANPDATIYTLEGSPEIAGIADKNFKSLGITNIQIIVGNIDQALPKLLDKLPTLDMVFIDGNHRKESTLRYFKLLQAKLDSKGVIIVDDINWSDGMKKAWEQIKKHQNTKGTLDFYQFGLVFLDSERAFDLKIRPPLKWLF